MTMQEQAVAVPSRRWPRFTLRLLLVVVTLFCLGLGWWTHRAREQRRIVERIQSSGGSAIYEGNGPDNPPQKSVFAGLKEMLGRDYFDEVVGVRIHERELVSEVAKLRKVKQLQIFCEELNDQDVALLARCQAIEVLNLGAVREYGLSQVTDRSLLVLSQLPRLRVLHVRGASVSETGIDALAASPTMQVLDVGSCARGVDASDFDDIKQWDRIKSLLAWRAVQNGPDEIIARW